MSSKCNTLPRQNLSGSETAEAFSGAVIYQVSHEVNILLRNRPKIRAFWKEEAKEVVGVLVGSVLPGLVGFGEIDEGL